MDFILDGCQRIEEVTTPDGKIEKQLIFDPERAYWKGHLVNSPTFARMVFELKGWEGKALQCYNYMTKERADVMSSQIMDISQWYRYSIDAKSSESLRDKNNTQSTLIDKINRNKIERAYTMKSEGGKSILSGLIGRDREREQDEDQG